MMFFFRYNSLKLLISSVCQITYFPLLNDLNLRLKDGDILLAKGNLTLLVLSKLEILQEIRLLMSINVTIMIP